MSLHLAADLVAPRAARHAIEHLLVEELDVSDQFVADAVLLTSELVTNAVLYTAAEFSISAEFDPSAQWLRVEVADSSSDAPVVQVGTLQRAGGHGLRIVAAISRRWGVAKTDRGKVVWFELGV